MAPDPLLTGRDDTGVWNSDPLTTALHYPDAVLAIITAISGPSYRQLGDIMAFCGDRRIGSLSSGCIESDLSRHAETALVRGPSRVRYGEGSPWLDLRLPCGGGLEITLLPRPSAALLGHIAASRAARERVAFVIDDDLSLRACAFGATGAIEGGFRVALLPPPRFLIFGQGAEAQVFTGLANAAGYPHLLLAADADTVRQAQSAGLTARLLHWPALPTDLSIDDRTAVVLFFHDHDWEPPILARALNSPAFYIGAQGSLRARDARLEKLRELGVKGGLDSLHGPIGMIARARDPRVLAISVLAEVLGKIA